MISVCIPTYNGELFIKKQLDSILHQSTAVDEIIISDDSSTDRTVEIIKLFNDPRIRLFQNQQFSNPIFNLENTLKLANGDYVFLADQDDIWEHNKVELLLKILQTNSLVVSDGQIINRDGEVIAPSIFNILKSRSGFGKNFLKNSYMGCCMAFNKDLLMYILPFPKGIAMHDLWIGLNAEIYANPCFYSEKLIRYRRHEQNKTPLDYNTNTNSFWYKFSFRLTILFLIAKRFIERKLFHLHT